jgi:hypothetical protein
MPGWNSLWVCPPMCPRKSYVASILQNQRDLLAISKFSILLGSDQLIDPGPRTRIALRHTA